MENKRSIDHARRDISLETEIDNHRVGEGKRKGGGKKEVNCVPRGLIIPVIAM